MGIGVSFLKNLVLVTIYLLNVYGYILYVRVSNVSVGFVLFFPLSQVCPGSPPGVWVCSTDMMMSISTMPSEITHI